MESIVDYKNVELSRKELIVLKDVSLKISRGEFVYLIGKVGSGKSTLIKCLNRIIPVKGGSKTSSYLPTARYTTICCLCSGQPAGTTSGKSTSALRQY